MAIPNPIGQTIDKYRIIEQIGQGGFGTVFKAQHVLLQKFVALKLLTAQNMNNDERAAFLAEAQIAASFDHPNIITVTDFGEWSVGGNKIPYLVMTLISGNSLRKKYPLKSKISIAELLTYLKAIASALDYAHEKRVIHRDIKPDNILIGDQGKIYLTDFGIAAVAHSQHSMRVQDSIGTAEYISPEQARGYPVTQSDQYSLAIMAYEFLAGKVPYESADGNPISTAMMHITEPVPEFPRNVSISPQVSAVIRKALSKDVPDRYRTVTAFVDQLEATAASVAAVDRAFPPSPSPQKQPSSGIKPVIQTPMNRSTDAIFTFEKNKYPVISLLSGNQPGLYFASDSVGFLHSFTTKGDARSKQVGSASNSTLGQLSWSPSGIIGTGKLDQQAIIWNSLSLTKTAETSLRPISVVTWGSNPGEVLIGDETGKLTIWNVSTGNYTSTNLPAGIKKIAVSEYKRFAVLCSDNVVYTMQYNEAQNQFIELFKYSEHPLNIHTSVAIKLVQYQINHIQWVSNQYLVLGTEGLGLILLNFEGQKVRKVEVIGPIRHLFFHKASQKLAIGYTGGKFNLYDIRASKFQDISADVHERITALTGAQTSNELAIASGKDNKVYVYKF